MAKKMYVDFFNVEKIDPNQADFEDSLAEINSIPHASTQRNILYRDIPIRLDSIMHSNSGTSEWTGDFVKIRMNDIPPAISLNSNQGLGEESAFVYYPADKVIVVQRNYYGVSQSFMRGYIEKQTKSKAEYKFFPIIKPEVFEKVKKMRSIKRFDIKFCDIKNFKLLKSGDSVSSIVSNLNELDAINANIQVSVGRTDKSLKKNLLLDILSKLFKNEWDNVKSIELEGLDEHSEKAILNLLDDRITYGSEIKNIGERTLSRQKRIDFLRSAWDHCKGDIRKILKP